MLDRTRFYPFDNRIRNAQNGVMSKTCHYLFPAIDSRKVHIGRITAEFKSFFDDGCEVFIFTNVYEFRVRYYLGGKYTIGIAGFRRHQTVGGKEDWRGNIRKFLLLILPGCAEIAFEMRIFFQFRICVCRKHFSMCVDIDAFVFRLFK